MCCCSVICQQMSNGLLQYGFYGTPVVKACIEAGTHHIDVCGEPGVSLCHCRCCVQYTQMITVIRSQYRVL